MEGPLSGRRYIEAQLLEVLELARRRYDSKVCGRDEYLYALCVFNNFILGCILPEFNASIPGNGCGSAEREKMFPRRLSGSPPCALTMQWQQGGVTEDLIRYVGDDGVLYELYDHSQWHAVGYVVSQTPN